MLLLALKERLNKIACLKYMDVVVRKKVSPVLELPLI